MKKIIGLLLALLLFTSCSNDRVSNVEITTEQSTESIISATQATTETMTETVTPELVYELNIYDIPAYSGKPYIELNNNEPGFYSYELTTEPFEIYNELDSLGRCGQAYANVCKEIMPTEERGKIGMIKPLGWHTVKYDFIDGKYLYNRCHLIGYQLSAENANERNLLTGTRYLNISGMLPFENMVADYVRETNNHVLYRVTPIFEGDNLLALGVQIEALSVEDNGNGIKFNVFCYNVQPGVGIDYAKGESHAEGEIATELTQNQAESGTGSANSTTYILNTNTKKFHYPTCPSVKQMKDKNKREFTGSRDEVIAQGYDSCARCSP